MGKIELERLVNFTYTRLPPVVVQRDLKISETRPPLYNFIRSMFAGHTDETGAYEMGAGELVLQRMNDFTNLIDPEKCPDEWFPYLYESFGLTYNPLIEENRSIYNPENPNYVGPYDGQVFYHRKFLSNIGALLKRRGSKAGLRYLVRVLTGLEFHYTYRRGYIDGDEGEEPKYGRFVTINLIADSTEKALELENAKKVVEQFLTPFIPHYITLIVGDSLTYTTITSKRSTVITPTYTVDTKTPFRGKINKLERGE